MCDMLRGPLARAEVADLIRQSLHIITSLCALKLFCDGRVLVVTGCPRVTLEQVIDLLLRAQIAELSSTGCLTQSTQQLARSPEGMSKRPPRPMSNESEPMSNES